MPSLFCLQTNNQATMSASCLHDRHTSHNISTWLYTFTNINTMTTHLYPSLSSVKWVQPSVIQLLNTHHHYIIKFLSELMRSLSKSSRTLYRHRGRHCTLQDTADSAAPPRSVTGQFEYRLGWNVFVINGLVSVAIWRVDISRGGFVS